MTTELAEILQAQVDAVLAEKDVPPLEPFNDEDHFANWYLSELARCDEQEARIKEQAEVLQRQVNARRAYLAWAHGDGFTRIVAKRLATQPGKKKSVDFACGRAGSRKKAASLLVTDKEEAVAWVPLENCPDAVEVVIQRRTPLKKHAEETGEVPPGCEFNEARDAFYPAVSEKLIEEHREELLRLEGQTNDE